MGFVQIRSRGNKPELISIEAPFLAGSGFLL